ncbi:hypothetical protein G7068_07755 [Leucobacter viscericola]|uniref:HTH luxR-type domain-containing protein n=1 Tax=Leucobacter viscericola TaxID=2714935 RepID=A0A6G7XF61_9MICO|nr:LuxR family transcriptional regulator [Leucobacter viscericola]QIK63106.1 hypothetical protein G7068_07755 [Leucobacter viscericola]
MIGRSRELRTAIDLVINGESVNVVGVRLSGRTTFLAELSRKLEEQGWNVVSVQGIVSLSSNPLTALQLANIQEDSASAATTTLGKFSEGLRHLASRPKTAIVIDDWNDIDEASWGIIDHTRRTTGCSVVMTRLTGTTSSFTPTGLAGSSADASFVVSLPQLRFDELEQVLMARLGAPLDLASTGAIFRKTNGVIGLAVAIADAAVRESRMRNIDGVWTAVQDLWSDGIAGLVEGYLEPLDANDVDALEMLSMIGTVDSSTLEELIDWSTVETLEERSYLSFYATQGSELATVQPPLLVDYFRHLPMSARRRRLRAHVSSHLGGEAIPNTFQNPSLLASSEQQSQADAHFARLSNEQLGARWLVTKAEWDSNPSQETALAYVLALLALNDPGSQVSGVFDAAQEEDSGEQTAVAFAITHAMWIGIYKGDLDAGLSALKKTGRKHPKYSRVTSATAVLLETSMRDVPADFHELFEGTDGVSEWVVARVVEAQMFVLNAAGRFEDSIKIFERHPNTEQGTAYIPSAQYGLALLGDGRHADSLTWSLRAYDEARVALDLAAACQHGYVAALALVGQGDYEQASGILATILSAGAHAPFVRVNRISILNLAGVLAVRRGRQEMGEAYAREALALGSGPGPYPGQSPAWLQGHLLAFAGQITEAVQILRAESLDQWQRGFRVASLFAETAALDLEYSPEESARVRKLATEVDGTYFSAHLDYLDATHTEDPEALLDSASALATTGRPGLALNAVETAVKKLQHLGRNEEAHAALEHGAHLASTFSDSQFDTAHLKTAAVKLTDRERETVALVLEGMTNQQIAAKLVVSVRTVESHVHRVMRKVGVKSRHDLKERLGSSLEFD